MTKTQHYTGKRITYRGNLTLSSEIIVHANTVPMAPIEIHYQQDKPFEVLHVTVKLTALADGAVCDPQPSVLDRLLKIGAMNFGTVETYAHAQRAQTTATCGLPLQQLDGSTFRWTPTETIWLRRGEALQFTVAPRESFVIAMDGRKLEVDQIRVEITVEGDACVMADKEYRPTVPVGVEAPLG